MTDEERLLERARTYEQGALEELYDAYAPLVFAYLYRRLQNRQLAEDLTSEVFLRLLQAFGARQPWQTSVRGWLYRVAHNLVVDYYRRQPPQPVLALEGDPPDADHDPREAVSQRISRQQLHSALAQLTPEQQHVVVLRFGQQLSAKEVAEATGKSVSAVEALQHRALAALRRIMEPNSGSENT